MGWGGGGGGGRTWRSWGTRCALPLVCSKRQGW